MMRARRLLWQLWPWRWGRAGSALLRGVRMHPSAALVGTAGQFEFGRGSVIGARVRLDVGNAGRLVAGERIWLAADTEVQTATTVRIGTGTTVQRRSSINGSVRIGRGCILAPNVFISSGTHPFRAYPHLPIREQERLLADQPDEHRHSDRPIWIQDDCWLGVNAVICPGVTVGKGSIVGANAVVTRDVAPYSVVGGAPARTLSRRLVWQPPTDVSAQRAKDLVYALSGRVESKDRRAALTATLEESLQVVLATVASRVTIHYDAPRPISLTVGKHPFDVLAGEGVLEVPVGELSTGFGGSIIDIRVRPDADATANELRVFRLTGA